MSELSTNEIRPLIAESSTAESTTIAVVLGDIRDEVLSIPDYQRDSDQWDSATKSLLIESVINNLTIPAFFFEVSQRDGMEMNEVVDGQQRLTTLNEYHQNKFPLVSADDAPYISPNSVHYASKRFDELPKQYQQAFQKYRLSIIKLRNLGEMKLEIFRRINQGGTPLSGQDIRLAYYGDTSKSVVFIRLAGIFDDERASSRRSIDSALKKYNIQYPWVKDNYTYWHDWWSDKDISHGQKPSEMFLWSLIAIYYDQLNDLLNNSNILGMINCRYHDTIEDALDAFCGYLKYQDNNTNTPPLFMSFDEISNDFINHFMECFVEIVISGSSIRVTKYRLISCVIGNLYKMKKSFKDLDPEQVTKLVEFIRKPQDTARNYELTFPSGKGRWAGNGGYCKQFDTVKIILQRMLQ